VATFFTLSRLGVITAKKHHVRKIDDLGRDLTRIALERSLAAGPERQPELSSRHASAREFEAPTATQESAGSRVELPDTDDSGPESESAARPRDRDRS